jgi:CYTH domain-containing protein
MAKEIERRFLVRGEFPLDIGRPKLIKQGYIFAGKDKQLRIR